MDSFYLVTTHASCRRARCSLSCHDRLVDPPQRHCLKHFQEAPLNGSSCRSIRIAVSQTHPRQVKLSRSSMIGEEHNMLPSMATFFAFSPGHSVTRPRFLCAVYLPAESRVRDSG